MPLFLIEAWVQQLRLHLIESPLHKGLEVYDISGVVLDQSFKGAPVASLIGPPEQHGIKSVHAVDI